MLISCIVQLEQLEACELKQTFKPGPNRERHFFTCAKQRCRTFQWLDAQLPTCAHGRTKHEP